MSDHVDDPRRDLNPLPPPPLATADFVRQRRLRTRLAGAAAAVVLLVGAGVTASAVTDRRGGGALVYAPQPSPTKSSQPATPSPCEPSQPCSDGTPEFVIAAHLLLQPADAERLSGGTWTSSVQYDEPSPRLRVCADGAMPADAGTTGVMRRTADGASVISQVVGWDARPGADALAALRADVARCPSRQADTGSAEAVVEHELLRTPKPYAVALRETSRDCSMCPPQVRLWVAVEYESYVSYTAFPPSESDSLAAWTLAAHDRIVCSGRLGCPNETPYDDLEASEGPLEPSSSVRLNGMGPIVIGMTLEEAQAAAGQPFTAFVDDLENGCGFVAPRTKRPNVSFMVVDGRVARVDVGSGAVRTDRALGVGSTEAQVHAAYGIRVEVLPHPYAEGNYLRIASADGRYVLVFETDGAEVTSYRTGTVAAAALNEGCA